MRKYALIYYLFLFQLPYILWAQNGLHFDGIDDRVDCGNSLTAQITGGQITLEAMIYAHSWKSNVWQGCVINKEQNGFGSDFGYMLRVGDGGKINFNLGNGSWNELTTDTLLSLNTWYHIAATYDSSEMKIYIDGAPVDSINVSISIGNSINNLIIGDYTGFNRNFDGIIDEVRIWDKARTRAEINNQMGEEMCGSIPGLAAYYKFNQGVASGNNLTETILVDKSGNSNNGNLTGFALSGPVSNWVNGAQIISFDSYDTISPVACNSYTGPSGTQTWNTSGSYIDVIPNLAGCDSIITINLTINTNTSSSISITECFQYVSPSGNHIWTSSGNYSDTIPNGAGCDSIISVNLTINDVDTSITISGNTLISNALNASYQWIDCSSGMVLDTMRFFTPPATGAYRVVVTENNCTDTSRCVSAIVFLEESGSEPLDARIFPNPMSGDFKILSTENGVLGFEIRDLSGRIILSGQTQEETPVQLPPSLLDGMYLIKLNSSGKTRIQKVLIRKK